MATLAQLHSIARSGALIPKIAAAVAKTAEAIRTESGATANHDNRLKWAKQAFSAPETMAGRMIWPVLAQNSGATEAQITGASDAAIESAVLAAVDVFATGE